MSLEPELGCDSYGGMIDSPVSESVICREQKAYLLAQPLNLFLVSPLAMPRAGPGIPDSAGELVRRADHRIFLEQWRSQCAIRSHVAACAPGSSTTDGAVAWGSTPLLPLQRPHDVKNDLIINTSLTRNVQVVNELLSVAAPAGLPAAHTPSFSRRNEQLAVQTIKVCLSDPSAAKEKRS